MIKKCPECNSYTLKEQHCGENTNKARPPKFSFPDKYGDYRRKTKKNTDNT
ncbi:MAG: nucleolar RNA-binding Nop10p family protein [Candidatus Nanohaloarchaea archaeon]